VPKRLLPVLALLALAPLLEGMGGTIRWGRDFFRSTAARKPACRKPSAITALVKNPQKII